MTLYIGRAATVLWHGQSELVAGPIDTP